MKSILAISYGLPFYVLAMRKIALLALAMTVLIVGGIIAGIWQSVNSQIQKIESIIKNQESRKPRFFRSILAGDQ